MVKPSRATPTLTCSCSGSDTSLAHCCNLAGGPGIPDDGNRARNSGTDEIRKAADKNQTLRGTSISSSHTIFWVWQTQKPPGIKNEFISLDLLQLNSAFNYHKDTSATSREKQRKVCCLSSAAFLCYDFLLLLGGLPHPGENVYLSQHWMQIKQKTTLISDVQNKLKIHVRYL